LSSYTLGRVPTEQKHAFTEGQILALSDSVWDRTKGQFTPEQQSWRP